MYDLHVLIGRAAWRPGVANGDERSLTISIMRYDYGEMLEMRNVGLWGCLWRALTEIPGIAMASGRD
jgi:hypothetical protein